ncbi:MAG TPA: ATP-binding protein [Steroidobacteraceae bacterium]|nr:ATP-binding protein [Steroidobacteraceae bacterium]
MNAPYDQTAVTQGPLRQVQPELETLLDAAIDGVMIVDHKGRVRLMSHAAELMFDRQETDVLGHNINLLLPEFETLLQRHVIPPAPGNSKAQRIRSLGQHHETVGLRSDGIPFEVELGVGTVRGIEPSRYVVFVRDISERKLREEALRRSEAALHTAQALANIGNYVIYNDGVTEDYASPQLMRMFEWHITESGKGLGCLTTRILAAVHPADRVTVSQAFAELDSDTVTIDINYRIINGKADTRYIHHLAQVIRDAHGRAIQHVGTVHDITERQLADYELQQMQNRITHSGRVSILGEMATGIAHEVNQPLTAIATYAKACLRLMGNDDCSTEEINTTLEQIAQQALRAGEVIRRMRSFVRYHEARPEMIDSNHLLEELVQLAQTDAHYHSVQLVIEPQEQALLVQADPVQIQQVLLNLVRNSIDAMQEVPEQNRLIILRARRNHDGDVEFMVADRGHGISAEIARELFNPFYTTKLTGTGLGLSISQSIIRAHGGKLWHDDNPGGGARFFFSLPQAG